MSKTSSNVIQLLKILIGVAWLDGTVQQAEQVYLRKIAHDKGVEEDPELQPWLHGLRSVSKEECYAWVADYLGKKPHAKAYQQLLEDLSGLIYSDGDVAQEEAKFLTQLQKLDPSNTDTPQFSRSVTQAIQKLYQRWINS